ncbi:Hypothetical predicted protein, partial [Olea europaea subsp. europaea]
MVRLGVEPGEHLLVVLPDEGVVGALALKLGLEVCGKKEEKFDKQQKAPLLLDGGRVAG